MYQTSYSTGNFNCNFNEFWTKDKSQDKSDWVEDALSLGGSGLILSGARCGHLPWRPQSLKGRAGAAAASILSCPDWSKYQILLLESPSCDSQIKR